MIDLSNGSRGLQPFDIPQDLERGAPRRLSLERLSGSVKRALSALNPTRLLKSATRRASCSASAVVIPFSPAGSTETSRTHARSWLDQSNLEGRCLSSRSRRERASSSVQVAGFAASPLVVFPISCLDGELDEDSAAEDSVAEDSVAGESTDEEPIDKEPVGKEREDALVVIGCEAAGWDSWFCVGTGSEGLSGTGRRGMAVRQAVGRAQLAAIRRRLLRREGYQRTSPITTLQLIWSLHRN